MVFFVFSSWPWSSWGARELPGTGGPGGPGFARSVFPRASRAARGDAWAPRDGSDSAREDAPAEGDGLEALEFSGF